jgi:hypothetical protein
MGILAEENLAHREGKREFEAARLSLHRLDFFEAVFQRCRPAGTCPPADFTPGRTRQAGCGAVDNKAGRRSGVANGFRAKVDKGILAIHRASGKRS